MSKKMALRLVLLIIIGTMMAFTSPGDKKPVAKIASRKTSGPVSARWDDPQWKSVKEIRIDNFTGEIPPFKPVTVAKMTYDRESLYLIFRVNDKHVRALTKDINGPVSGDACVEFFFSPDISFPERYFNLEINAAGTPLLGYHIDGRKDYKLLKPEEISQIEIVHSLPGPLEQEIAEEVTWTVACRIPLSVLRQYSNVTQPAKGVEWRANFYKTSSRSSNPHWVTWSVIDTPVPDFHRAEFFGTVMFN